MPRLGQSCVCLATPHFFLARLFIAIRARVFGAIDISSPCCISIFPQFHISKSLTSKDLKKTLKKGVLKTCLSQKKCYFCTRNRVDGVTNSDVKEVINVMYRVIAFIQKIKQKRFARKLKRDYLCHPLIQKRFCCGKKRKGNFFFEKLARLKKRCTFAPALRDKRKTKRTSS